MIILIFKDYLLQLIKQFVKEVPVETCIVSLETLLAIAYLPKLRDILINLDIFDTICLLLEVYKITQVHILISSNTQYLLKNFYLFLVRSISWRIKNLLLQSTFCAMLRKKWTTLFYKSKWTSKIVSSHYRYTFNLSKKLCDTAHTDYFHRFNCSKCICRKQVSFIVSLTLSLVILWQFVRELCDYLLEKEESLLFIRDDIELWNIFIKNCYKTVKFSW